MKQRGRPVLGAFAGLFLGLFLALDLVIFGILPLDSNILALMPVIGLAAGIGAGLTAPIKGRNKDKKRLPIGGAGPSAA
jgi:hypothetical protein